MNKTFISADEHPLLNDILDKLILNQFLRENNFTDRIEFIDEKQVESASFLASILSSSDDENHQLKAIAFGVLTFLNYPDDTRFENLCYIILSRTGNIQLSKHLKSYSTFELSDAINHFDNILKIELATSHFSSGLKIGDEKILTSNYQMNIWDAMNNFQGISISAPTSSGKSFILQNYFINECLTKKRFTGLYVVPTRALISEVSIDLKKG